MKTIMVVGGYGNFGKRLTESLALYYDYHVIIAGRSLDKARQLQCHLNEEHSIEIEVKQLDVLTIDLKQKLAEIPAQIIVNASGPFQYQLGGSQNYALARACAELGKHYVDLADARSFVSHFTEELNNLAKEKLVTLVAGASTVPGLSSAVIEYYQQQGFKLKAIDYVISPGNKTERGLATVASILSYTGQAIENSYCQGNYGQNIYGWQGLRLKDFGQPLGKRWMSHCEIPDLDLIPERYPEIKRLRFQAGLEVTLLHVGLWLLSWLPRLKLLSNLDKYSQLLTTMSEWFSKLGSDAGGMFVEFDAVDESGKEKSIAWQLIAEQGVGPNVPTIAAEIIVQKIASGAIDHGAMPCAGLFTLDEFQKIAQRWGITFKESVDDK